MRFFLVILCFIMASRALFGGNYDGSLEKFFSQMDLSGNVSVGFNSFRSIPEGTWQNSNGTFFAANLAYQPKHFFGFGLQAGASFGLYDWAGRGLQLDNSKQLQQQAFITGGVYRFTPSCSGINFGVVTDQMFNKNAGVFGLNPSFGQLRAQLGYLVDGRNEFGLWGTLGYASSHKELSGIPIRFKAINQASVFWAHYFKNCASTMIWLGIPYSRSLFFNSGRSGDYLFGARAAAPLACGWNLTGSFAYMSPRHAFGSDSPSQVDACNVSIGINYAFGSQKIGKQPYMSLADNSNFLVDTNFSN